MEKHDRIQTELRAIRSKGRVDTNTIQVVEKNDHKNISLWTKLGKRIGPMHPHNAEKTLTLFAEGLGVELSATQPTPAQVEAYKQSDEYKQWKEKLDKDRARKEQSRAKGRIEEYIKKIAEMSGQTVEAIHKIARPDQVKPMSEAREKLS